MDAALSDRCWHGCGGKGTFIHCLWECPAVNLFWSEVTKALSEIFLVRIPKCPVLCILGGTLDGVGVRVMRDVTLGCMAARRRIVMNWKIRAPSCFSLSGWLEEFIDLIGLESSAASLWQLDLGLDGLWDRVRSYLSSLPE